MKGSKYSKGRRPWSLNGMLRSRRTLGGAWTQYDYNVCLLLLAGLSGLIILLCRDVAHMHKSSSFHSNRPDWDKQRAIWMDEHPALRPREGERPKILMVTGSSPQSCEPAIASHVILRSAKNKVDYCRLHGIPLYYSLSSAEPELSTDWWVTLPVIRMLALQHPEVDWIWWVDADAVFTDMSLEPPLPELKDQNLVIYEDGRKDWPGVHAGNYLIRNCQWSLDLIDSWGSGDAHEKLANAQLATTNINWSSTRTTEGKKLTAVDDHRLAMVADLLQTQNAEYQVKEAQNWTLIGPKLEELRVHEHGGVPLLTHFSGCLPCSATPRPADHDKRSTLASQEEKELEPGDFCQQQLDRTLDFADNQVYREYGFHQRKLGSSKLEPLIRYAPAMENGVETKASDKDSPDPFRMLLPRITDWDEQRRVRMEKIPSASVTKNKTMLASGSAPKPCVHGFGDHVQLRSMKNKLDYCRLHGIEIFYNMAMIDRDLTGWWSKIPLLRMLMLEHPEVEWFWWMDSDTVITDMGFEIPFDRYNDYNLVLYGEDRFVYEEKKYIGTNTGIYFIRNCQWTMDLFDRWASFAMTTELKLRNGEFLSDFLSDRPKNWEGDDQSVFVYLLITEREKWGDKVLLENTVVDLSGSWTHWTPRFAHLKPQQYKPFVTHFAGCTPCGGAVHEECLVEMDRTFNFADNQVLEPYGLCHEHLKSPNVIEFVPAPIQTPV